MAQGWQGSDICARASKPSYRQVEGEQCHRFHSVFPSPWAPSPAQDPEVDHALVESSLAEGEGGWWGLVVCLKKDQMGRITQTTLQLEARQGLLHPSLLQSLDSKKGLQLQLMQQPG